MKVQKYLKIHYSYFSNVENSFIECSNHLLPILFSSDVTIVQQTNKWIQKLQLCVIKHRHCPLPLPPFPCLSVVLSSFWMTYTSSKLSSFISQYVISGEWKGRLSHILSNTTWMPYIIGEKEESNFMWSLKCRIAT